MRAGSPSCGATDLRAAPSNLNRFDLARLRDGLRPFRLHWFTRLRSTSDHAAELRRRGRLFAPAAVLASVQTAGRGRGGNAWHSGPGSLTITFALPAEEHLAVQQLALVAGLAVRQAAADLAGCQAIALKWPNDLLHSGRKLAGVLCERIDHLDLVGIGLNVNLDCRAAPAPLQRKITSLAAIAGRPIDLTQAAIAVAAALSAVLARRASEPFAALVAEYDRHHALVGRAVLVDDPGLPAPLRGRCCGLDQRGRLIVESGASRHALVAGQVRIAGQ